MPGPSRTMSKERKLLGVKLLWQDPDTIPTDSFLSPRSNTNKPLIPFFPFPQYITRKLRTGAVKHRQVRKPPIPISDRQFLQHSPQNRVSSCGCHQIVIDAKRLCFRPSSRKRQQRIQGPATRDIHIHVDASIVPEHKVLESVDALDGVFVSVTAREKPCVMGF